MKFGGMLGGVESSTKKTLKKILYILCFIVGGFFVTGAGEVRADAYLVDAYIDFESGISGNLMTISDITASSHGIPGPSGSSNHMYISSAGQYSLTNPVQVGSTIYDDATGTRGFMYDPEGTIDTDRFYFTFPSPLEKASFGSYFMSTSESSVPLSIVEAIVSGGGDYVVTHWTACGSGVGLHINSNDSGCMQITPGQWYWVTGVWEKGGLNQIELFNADSGLLVGRTYLANAGTHNALGYTLGRAGSDTNSGVGQWYFDNVILSYSGIFPLIPFTPTNPTPVHNFGTGTYGNSVNVAISNMNPNAQIYYCTDLTGTCTPDTLYSSPIAISTTETHLRSLARDSDWNDSAITESVYTITNGATYVQATTGQSGGTTGTAVFTNPVSAKNIIALGTLWLSGTITLDSVTDNCNTGGTSNTYTILDNPTSGGAGGNTRAAMAYAIVGADTESCTITVTLSGSASKNIVAEEITGVDPTTPIDNNQHNIKNGTTTGGTDSLMSNSITTTNSDAYIFGFNGVSSDVTAGTGYTMRATITANGFYAYVEDKKLVSPGSTAASFTKAAATYNLTGVIAFNKDITAPAVTNFTTPSTFSSLSVPVLAFTATDNLAVVGYVITELSSPPSLDDTNWTSSTPTHYTFSEAGPKTLYAWARDAIGNISMSASDMVTVALSTYTRADVDSSSAITTTDALLTLRNSLGLSMTGTAWQASATTGDVNCDGVSNSTDALLILRYSLGLSMTETGWCE